MLADVLLKVAGMEKKDEQAYRPRPSSSGPERCLRQLVYKACGVKAKKMGDRFVVVLNDSSWHEELTADWIRKTAYQLHSQQLVVNCGTTTHLGQPFDVVGSIDGIITDLVGVDRLWEHKAINHFTFEKLLNGHYPMDYLTQCCLYLVGLQKVNPAIREALLLVKNKNTSAYLEYLLDYDSANDVLWVKHLIGSNGTFLDGPVEFTGMYRGAFDRFARVEAHHVAGTLPDRQYQMDDWQCDYCPFGDTCYENIEQEIAAMGEAELDGEVLMQATEYRELAKQMTAFKKRQDDLKDAIKGWLRSASIKKATSNGLSVELSLGWRSSMDESLIPPEIIRDARKESPFEKLSVKESRKGAKS